MKDNSSKKTWYVIYVRLYHERKIAENLQKTGIDVFLPIQKEYHCWSDRMKLVEHLVLPMVLFIHITPEQRRLVFDTPGYIRFFVNTTTHLPAIIPNEQ